MKYFPYSYQGGNTLVMPKTATGAINVQAAGLGGDMGQNNQNQNRNQQNQPKNKGSDPWLAKHPNGPLAQPQLAMPKGTPGVPTGANPQTGNGSGFHDYWMQNRPEDYGTRRKYDNEGPSALPQGADQAYKKDMRALFNSGATDQQLQTGLDSYGGYGKVYNNQETWGPNSGGGATNPNSLSTPDWWASQVYGGVNAPPPPTPQQANEQNRPLHAALQGQEMSDAMGWQQGTPNPVTETPNMTLDTLNTWDGSGYGGTPLFQPQVNPYVANPWPYAPQAPAPQPSLGAMAANPAMYQPKPSSTYRGY